MTDPLKPLAEVGADIQRADEEWEKEKERAQRFDPRDEAPATGSPPEPPPPPIAP